MVGTHGDDTQVQTLLNPPGYGPQGHPVAQRFSSVILPSGSKHHWHPRLQSGVAVVVVVVAQSHPDDVVVVEVVVLH